MTEITLNITGSEARQILSGLLQMGYEHGHKAEAEVKKHPGCLIYAVHARK